MKCFHVDDETVTTGLHVRRDRERPYVRITSVDGDDHSEISVALSPELAERLPPADETFQHSSRLLRCDVSRRGQLWLGPESDATKFDGLVMFSVRWYTLVHTSPVSWKLSFDGQPGEILDRTGYFIPAAKIGKKQSIHCLAALVRMPPGSCLTVAGTEIQNTVPIRWVLGARALLSKVSWQVKFSGGELRSERVNHPDEHPAQAQVPSAQVTNPSDPSEYVTRAA